MTQWRSDERFVVDAVPAGHDAAAIANDAFTHLVELVAECGELASIGRDERGVGTGRCVCGGGGALDVGELLAHVVNVDVAPRPV